MTKPKITVMSDGRFQAWVDGYLVCHSGFSVICQMIRQGSWIIRKGPALKEEGDE